MPLSTPLRVESPLHYLLVCSASAFVKALISSSIILHWKERAEDRSGKRGAERREIGNRKGEGKGREGEQR